MSPLGRTESVYKYHPRGAAADTRVDRTVTAPLLACARREQGQFLVRRATFGGSSVAEIASNVNGLPVTPTSNLYNRNRIFTRGAPFNFYSNQEFPVNPGG